MPDDLKAKFDSAAAEPSRGVPLSVIERRIRARGNSRRGALLVAVFLLAGGIGGVIAATGDGSPSVQTRRDVQPASGSPERRVTIELPPGWIETPADASSPPGTVLLVGSAPMSPSTDALRCAVVRSAKSPSPEVFIQVIEGPPPTDVGGFQGLPADFRQFPTIEDHGCTIGDSSVLTAWSYEWPINAGDRSYQVILTVGDSANEDEAFAVLNTLELAGPPLPVSTPSTSPPSTVPPSADTEAITTAFEGWVSVKPPAFDNEAAFVEDWASIAETARAASEAVGNPQCYTGRVDAITRISDADADVIFTFLCDGQPASIVGQQGRAVKINGKWLVSRETACAAYAVGGYHCPPRE